MLQSFATNVDTDTNYKINFEVEIFYFPILEKWI